MNDRPPPGSPRGILDSMRALLAGGTSVDTVAIALAVGLAVSISLLGSLLPALRAARVDPTIAIREG